MSDIEKLKSEIKSVEDQIKERCEELMTSISSSFDRISSWLVLGNTGALVLVFQSILAKGGCASGSLDELAAPFVWGLLLGFVAIVTQQTERLITLNAAQKLKSSVVRLVLTLDAMQRANSPEKAIAAKNANEGVKSATDNMKKHANNETHATIAVIFLLAASGLSFAYGVGTANRVVVSGTVACEASQATKVSTKSTAGPPTEAPLNPHPSSTPR